VVDAHTGDLHFGAGAARVSVPGLSESRAIRIEQDVLGANNQVAQQNRAHFHAHGVRALNLVSSPGSGKTTLLCATIRALQQQHRIAAIFLDAGADHCHHRQPVPVSHVGAVDRWQQLAKNPVRLFAGLHQRLLRAHPRLEAGRRNQAIGTHLHANGAAGVEQQKFFATHARLPLFG